MRLGFPAKIQAARTTIAKPPAIATGEIEPRKCRPSRRKWRNGNGGDGTDRCPCHRLARFAADG
jgi:hypothetical protein